MQFLLKSTLQIVGNSIMLTVFFSVQALIQTILFLLIKMLTEYLVWGMVAELFQQNVLNFLH